MKYKDRNYIFLRSFFFLCFFILLHYSYDWFPNNLVALFSGINESMYQHMKIGFYAYFLLMALEALLFRNHIENRQKWVYSHLFCAVILPSLIFVLWYIAAATIGEFSSVVIEIIYANIITYGVLVVSSIIFLNIISMEMTKSFKVIIIILLIVTVIEFTIFTFELPWADIFSDPYA